jgi:hypothetical protein
VANLPPVSTTQAKLVAKFAAGVVDAGGKFATGINNTSETGGKVCRRCRDTGGAPLHANISGNFRKKSKRS